MSIRVSIVEDDAKIREGLVVLIEGSQGFRCVSAYESAEDALRDIHIKDPDVVLMDINLPEMSGIECVWKLKESNLKMQIIMLTVYEDADRIFKSLEAGASGYILKRIPPVELLQAITDVHNGGSPMSSQIARKVVQHFQKTVQPQDVTKGLSDREKEILNLLSKGFRYKEIAEQLFISPETVHSHLRRIYEKLQVTSRTEAVLKFLNK